MPSTAFLFCRCEEGRTELFCLMCLVSWGEFASCVQNHLPELPHSRNQDWWFLCKNSLLTVGWEQISDLPEQLGEDSVLHFRSRQTDKQFRGSWRRSRWHKWAFWMCYNLHWLLGLDLGLVVRWGRGISTLPYAFVSMVCFIDYFSIPQLHLAGFLSSIW